MKMTTRRWMLAVALIALGIVAAEWGAILIRDARQKAADERWADPYLRSEDEYATREARLEAYGEAMRKAEGIEP